MFFLMAALFIFSAAFAQESRETDNAMVLTKNFTGIAPATSQFLQTVEPVQSVPQMSPPNRAVILSAPLTSAPLPTGWTTIDADGDGYTWQFTSINQSCGTNTTTSINSASYYNCILDLTPDNWLITPQITLNGATEIAWRVALLEAEAGYDAEHYGVYISTTGTNPSDFTLLFEETTNYSLFNSGINRTTIANHTGPCYIAFRHFNCSDQYILLLSNVSISTPPVDPTINITSPIAFGTIYNNVPMTYTQDVTITNRGQQPLTLNLTSATPGFTITNLPSSIPALGSATITVTLSDNTAMHAGTFSGNFVLTTNDPENPTVTVAVTATVTTALILPYISENFNAAAPTGWAYTSNFSRQTSGGVGGTACMRANLYSSSTTGALQTPFVQMGSNPIIEFKYQALNYSGGAAAASGSLYYGVYVSTDFSPTYYLFGGQVPHTSSANFTTITLPASVFANTICQVQIYFWWVSGDYYVRVDDIVVGTPLTTPTIDATSPFAFGSAYNNLPFTTTKAYTVKNAGPDPLIVTSVVSSSPEITVTGAFPITIASGATANVNVTLDLNGKPDGAYSGNFVLASNDPNTPQKTIVVHATAAPALISDFIEEDFNTAMPTGWTITPSGKFSRQTTGGLSDGPCLRANVYGTSSYEGTIQPIYVNMGANPEFSFYYNATMYSGGAATAADAVTGYADISVDNGVTWNRVWTLNSGEHVPTTASQFNFIDINVSAYANQLVLARIYLRSGPLASNPDIYVRVDNVTIGTPPQKELAITSFTGPLYPIATVSNDYVVTVKNNGRLTTSSYTVSILTEDDVVLATETVTDPLVWGATRTFTFPFIFDQAQGGTTLKIKAVVELAGDEVPANNVSSLLTLNILAHPGYELQNCRVVHQFFTGTGTTYNVPLNTYYRWSYIQQIFEASEMTAIPAGTPITALTFDYFYATAQDPKPLVVYLGYAPQTTFANANSYIPLAELTEVYNGTFTFSTTSRTIEFDQPFIYNGGNLVVAVLNNHGDYNTSNSPTFRTHTATNKVLQFYRDGTSANNYLDGIIDPANPTAAPPTLTSGVLSTRSNIQFHSCDKYYTLNKNDIYCDPAVVSVTLNPTNPVLEGTNASVDINITATALANHYQISKLTIGGEVIPGTPFTQYTLDKPAISDVLPLIEVECDQFFPLSQAEGNLFIYGDGATHTNVVVNPNNPVQYGTTNAQINVTMEACYYISKIIYDGVDEGLVPPVRTWSKTIPLVVDVIPNLEIYTARDLYDLEVTAAFVDATNVVNYTGDLHGAVEFLTYTVDTDNPTETLNDMCGERVKFTFTPEWGYTIDAIIYNGVKLPVSSTIRTWTTPTDIDKNTTLEVRFKIAPYKIDFTYSGNGSGKIFHVEKLGTPDEVRTEILTTQPYLYFESDAAQLFIFTPETGSYLEAVKIDNILNPIATTIGSYVFPKLTSFNHTVEATFTLQNMIIKATAGANGAISPSGNVPVPYKQDKEFIITANTGYIIDKIWVDGIDKTKPLTLALDTFEFKAVDAAHTIYATFKKDTMFVTVTVEGCGDVQPNGVVGIPYNGTQIFNFMESAGCKVSMVYVDGVPYTNAIPTGSYTFYYVDNQPHTLHVVFETTTFPITAQASDYGVISDAGVTYVEYDQNKTYNFSALPGYEIKNVFVDGVNKPAAIVAGKWEFEHVTGPHTISVIVKPIDYIIKAEAAVGGYITPSGNITVPYLGGQLFTFAALPGYKIKEVLVDDLVNIEAAENGAYAFTNVAAQGHYIKVSFEEKIYKIMASAPGVGGSIEPAGMSEITYFDNITYTITPEQDYKISYVLVDGKDMGAINTFTYSQVEDNSDIQAFFFYDPDSPVTIGGQTLESLSIYSHTNVVYIVNENNIPLSDVTIFDMYGRVVWQGVPQHSITLNVANGIYAVRVTSGDNFTVTKVPIQK